MDVRLGLFVGRRLWLGLDISSSAPTSNLRFLFRLEGENGEPELEPDCPAFVGRGGSIALGVIGKTAGGLLLPMLLPAYV